MFYVLIQQRPIWYLILLEDSDLTLEKLREWGKARLASYKVPTRMRVLEDFPRNAMGKITKPKIKELFMNQDHSQFINNQPSN